MGRASSYRGGTESPTKVQQNKRNWNQCQSGYRHTTSHTTPTQPTPHPIAPENPILDGGDRGLVGVLLLLQQRGHDGCLVRQRDGAAAALAEVEHGEDDVARAHRADEAEDQRGVGGADGDGERGLSLDLGLAGDVGRVVEAAAGHRRHRRRGRGGRGGALVRVGGRGRGVGGRGEGVPGHARLALLRRLGPARQAAALQALVAPDREVVGERGFDVGDVLGAEVAEGGGDDVGGQAEVCVGGERQWVYGVRDRGGEDVQRWAMERVPGSS